MTHRTLEVPRLRKREREERGSEKGEKKRDATFTKGWRGTVWGNLVKELSVINAFRTLLFAR